MQLKSALYGSGFSLLISLFASGPSWASDPFVDGCASYCSGNFGKAKEEFLQAIKAKPKSWQAQYQLANSLLQLKDSVNAKLAYQKCLTLKPDSTVKAECESAIAYITNPPKPQVAPPAARPLQVVRPVSQSESSADNATAADDSRQAEIAARRANVMADGKRQVEAMKAEKEQAILDGNASSWHHYRRESGERYTALSSDERQSLEREYENKINQIMKETQRRADAITTP